MVYDCILTAKAAMGKTAKNTKRIFAVFAKTSAFFAVKKSS